jgi:MFS family permease
VGTRRRFGLVVTAVACGYASAGALLPVLPRYVTGELGRGDFAVGIATGALPVAMLISRPFLGRLADVRGPRTGVLIGLVACLLSAPLYAVAGSLELLIVARLMHGIGEAAVFTSGLVWALRLLAADRGGAAISYFGVAVWAGFSSGPLLGQAALDTWGYAAVWVVVAVAAIAGMALAATLPAMPPTPVPAGTRRSLVPRGAVIPGAGLACAAVGMAAMLTFLVLLCDERDLGGGAAAIAVFAAVTLVARIVLGRVPDRLGGRRSTFVAAAFGSVALLLVAVAQAWVVVALGAALWGLCWTFMFPGLGMLVVARVPAAERGAGLAVYSGFFDASFGLSAPLLGVVASAGGYGASFVVAAVLTAAAALAALRSSPSPSPAGEPAPCSGAPRAVSDAA